MKTFESIDKSFEERFDPKLRTIGESQLQNYDSQKEQIPPSKYFRIEFSKSIPEEIKIFLKAKLPAILDYPEKCGLQIPRAGHLLRFLDQQTYESEIGSVLQKNVILPASRLKNINSSRAYEVTIILPQELDSAELIVNITRNIFSKLCGDIFFNEQIKSLNYYQESLNYQKESTAAISEILFTVEELNFSSKSLLSLCESVASSYHLDLKKESVKIRNQLISEWREKLKNQDLTTDEQQILASIFREFKQSFRTNPENYNQILIKRIQDLNTQLHFILPHESGTYENFKKQRLTHYIRSVKNKLEEISSLFGFIEELNDFLNQSPEITASEVIGTQIRARMHELCRDKKVIQCYVPELSQNIELKRILQRFPLSLIKMLPSGTHLKDWSKEIKRMEKSYQESIYSKLYAALNSLFERTLAHKGKNTNSFKESSDGQHLTKLLSILKYRAPAIEGLQNALGVILDLSEKSLQETKDIERSRQLIPLEELSRAWSYFISSILSMHFYQLSSAEATLPQGFRTEKYLKSISEFVDRQCSRGINHFHIVKLLWLIYDEKGEDAINFLLYSIQKPQDILRYTLHLTMRQQTANITIEKRLEELFKYRDAWISVYQNRFNEVFH